MRQEIPTGRRCTYMKSKAKVAKLAGVVRDDDHPLPKHLRLSTMPSPIAWSPSSPSKSMFKKRSSSSLSGMTSAASYLAAVSQADARARAHTSTTPTVTPALSLSSSVGYLIPPHATSNTPLHHSRPVRANVNPVSRTFSKVLTILRNPAYPRLYQTITDIGGSLDNYKAATHSEH